MQQDQEEDPSLVARKAELLAMLDHTCTSRNVQTCDSEEKKNVDYSCSKDDIEIVDICEKDKAPDRSRLNDCIESAIECPQQNGLSVSANDAHSEDISKTRVDGSCSETLGADRNSGCARSPFNPLLALTIDKDFSSPKGNFTKGCKWSPDGSCLLVGGNDKTLRLYNLPSRVACGDILDERWFFDESAKHCTPALSVKEGECIFDYAWYPAMHSSNAESCCFAVTCRDLPVHLWDAYNGSLISSYLPYDHLDELVAAHSVTFSLDGSQIFCGFNRCIRVFRTCRPGREHVKIGAKDQPGIISCIAFNPVLPTVFASGSYQGNIGLYSTDRNAIFFRLDLDNSGITQLKFSNDGTKLFTGARMNNEILCWDMRNPGKLLWSFRREVKTHQRIYFDLQPQLNDFLVSGSTSGTVLKWNLEDLASPDDDNPPPVKAHHKFLAHKDCCNGVSLNPHFPVLATSSGQRHSLELQDLYDSSSEEDDKPHIVKSDIKQESSVKLWYLNGP